MNHKKSQHTKNPNTQEKIQQDNVNDEAASKYERVPLWCIIVLALCAVCAVIYLVTLISVPFADFFNTHIASFFRFILATITNILPFSLAELTIILSPVILVLVARYFAKKRCKTFKQTAVSLICILSIASLFFSCFVLTFSSGYRGYTLDQKLGIKREKLSAEELYDSTLYIVNEINKITDSISFGEDGFSEMPYDLGEMNDKLMDAYEAFSQKHDFINHFESRLKPVALSEAMSYAHITGVYTFFTGESNLNVNFPDYTVPFTAAHELAHQRGVAREDEANMVAFLVLLESDDEYIRYCAYVNMYEYLISALSKADKDMAKSVRSELDGRVYKEQIAYAKFFKKYAKSVTSQVSGAVNDAYLKGQGTEGEKSYGMVVDLTVAYLKKQNLT